MMQFTEEQKTALIEDCKREIEEIKKSLTTWGQVWMPYLRSKLQRQEIALASLTRPPATTLLLPKEADGSNLPFAANGWNACLAEVKRLNATAPQPDSSMNLGSFDPRPDFTPSCRIKTCHNNDGNQVED